MSFKLRVTFSYCLTGRGHIELFTSFLRTETILPAPPPKLDQRFLSKLWDLQNYTLCNLLVTAVKNHTSYRL
jgi:hypothetical protein